MRYTQQVLRPGEQVIAVGEFHWLYSVAAYLWLVVLSAFLIGVIIFFAMMIRKWTTKIVIPTDRLIYKTGWIARRAEEIPLSRIEEVALTQTVIGRLLGYGRIVVAGTGKGIIRLAGWLADPVGLRQGLCWTQVKDHYRHTRASR